MTWFKNLKVRSKMLVAFLVVVALLAALAIVALYEMGSVSDTYTYAIEHPIEAELQMMTFIAEARDLRRLTTSMVMFAPLNDPGRIDSLAKEAADTYARGVVALNAYYDTIATGTLSEKAAAALKRLDDLREVFRQYKEEVTDPVVTVSRTGDHAGGLAYAAAGAAATEGVVQIGAELSDLAAGSAKSNVQTAESESTRTVMIVVILAATAAVVSIIIAFLVSMLISKPLAPLSAFMSKAGSTGDIVLQPTDIAAIEKYANMKDEIGQAIGGCAEFINHIAVISQELESIAGGDLTTEVEMLSESDTMGKSLKNMVNNLNRMFIDINNSANQVTIGSKQVADGAQSLAQGSTEQAASTQQLSSSIAEIAQKTKTNAEIADKTAKLAEEIMGNAEKGSRQMDEMMSAVKDINQASQNISKVIKVIDDIAFQTNILALNAAVEAARAGQHGKGFAVVAEEVRSLASKSAEAAKETGSMIENSIEKAELGARIADETAASLADIVSGINESNGFIREISKASEEQSMGISQINIGIDQVAQVVQQNSATAEQSAASSEEMSGQSAMLQELISQFKLSTGSTGQRRLHSSSNTSAAVHSLPAPEPAETAYVGGGDFGKY